MIYTEEQFKLIAQAEPHFESIKREYIRNAPKWLTEQIINVYESATHNHILNKDFNCSICVMNIYKVIAKTYYSDLAERQKLQKELKSEVTTTEEQNTSEPTKKTKKSRNKKK